MKRAKQLLATTMRGVNEIAYGCGFSDPKYFSKCFKAAEGMSPSEYRTRVQNRE
jgi:transcriptional regulator GlxA family with amidase domain